MKSVDRRVSVRGKKLPEVNVSIHSILESNNFDQPEDKSQLDDSIVEVAPSVKIV